MVEIQMASFQPTAGQPLHVLAEFRGQPKPFLGLGNVFFERIEGVVHRR